MAKLLEEAEDGNEDGRTWEGGSASVLSSWFGRDPGSLQDRPLTKS